MTREEYEFQWKQCHSSSEHVDVCKDYIKSLEHHIKMYHNSEDDKAHLNQKINGLQLRVDKVLRWGRSMRDYAHKYHKQAKECEQQLANLKHNHEAQEIMIADYKKHIEELEVHKSCDGCRYLTQYGCSACAVCERHEKCIDRYEPKDKTR